MLKKVNIKTIAKNIGTLVIFIVMSITVMGMSSDIFRNCDFDEGIITGFRHLWKELTHEDGYMATCMIVCVAYCYSKLAKRIGEIFKRKEKKSDS